MKLCTTFGSIFFLYCSSTRAKASLNCFPICLSSKAFGSMGASASLILIEAKQDFKYLKEVMDIQDFYPDCSKMPCAWLAWHESWHSSSKWRSFCSNGRVKLCRAILIPGTRNFSTSEKCIFENTLSSTQSPPLPLSQVRGRKKMGVNAVCLPGKILNTCSIMKG